jgi:hypothetical protein
VTALVALCTIAVLAPAAPAAAAPIAAKPIAVPILATTIVLERSGGFAGTHDTFVVGPSTAGGERPRQLASSPDFLRLRGSYQPENPCCDRFSYLLTVTYRDGHRKTISTVQGTTAPKILWAVITGVEQVGTRTSRTA